ncbi:MAG: phosphopantetheine-binding protein [Planctomycetota bacterium]|jgi:acyl carrier protein
MCKEMREEIYDRLKETLVDTFALESEETITLQSRYKEDFDADSLDLLSLFIELKEQCGEDISMDEIKELATVGETLEYIVKNSKLSTQKN